MAWEEGAASVGGCGAATTACSEWTANILLNPCCRRRDEVAHLRSEQQAAREESLRLGAAAEKRSAIGECRWWFDSAGSSMHPELLSRAASPSVLCCCHRSCSVPILASFTRSTSLPIHILSNSLNCHRGPDPRAVGAE